jgi:radical SAM protein with 4Fe4S-binding SPASM domain
MIFCKEKLFLHPLATLLSKVYFGNSDNTSTIQAYFERLSIGGGIREGCNHLSFFSGSQTCLSYPRSVRFEVSSRCNLKCPMCPQPTKMTRPRQLLDYGLYQLVLDRNPHIEEVDLFNWGEPLLHPQLNEFISYATSKKIFSRLVTNAVLLNKERSESLLASGLKAIIFSLDNTGEHYQQIRGTSYDQTLKHIRFFIDSARKIGHSIHIGISMTRSLHNQPNLSAAAQELTELGADRIDINDCQEYTPTYNRTSRCMEPYRYMVILSDGKVTPCCVDYDGVLSFGSVLDEPNLGTLFNNKSIQHIRKLLKNPQTMPTLCSHCHYRVTARRKNAD